MGGYGGGPPPGGYGPPGGYPPPGMAPLPGPPGKGGSNVLLIVGIILAALVVLGGGSCAACICITQRAANKTEATSEPVKTVAPTPSAHHEPSNNNWITAERPYVKFLAPAGWKTDITRNKEWGVFTAPTGDAVLAFTTFNQPGESTVRIGKAASVLGVTDVNWRTPRYGNVGKDKFDARVADGTCNFKGPGGYIWYATVNTGTSDQILLIFTVAATAPQIRRNEAQGAIDTLQRR
jgi:hypothetical protein